MIPVLPPDAVMIHPNNPPPPTFGLLLLKQASATPISKSLKPIYNIDFIKTI